MQLEFEFSAAHAGPKTPPVEPAAAPPPAMPPPTAPVEDPNLELREAAGALRLALVERMKLTVFLTITDNRSRVASFQHDRPRNLVKVRLHRMFLTADATVLDSLAHWIAHPGSKSAGKVVDDFIRQHRDHLRPPRKRRVPVVAQGSHFNLTEMFEDINANYFSGRVSARITWGRMSSQRRRHSIRFGSYDEALGLIRINPVLDQAFVPAYFVRYIVYHEMLHAHLGVPVGPSGRRQIHPPGFKQAEERYSDYKRAVEWQNKPGNLRRLLNTVASPYDKLWPGTVRGNDNSTKTP